MRKYPMFILGLLFCFGIILSAKGFLGSFFAGIFFLVTTIIFLCTLNKKVASHFLLILIVVGAGMLNHIFYNTIPKKCISKYLSNTKENKFIIGKIVNDPVFFRDRFYQPKQDLLIEVFQIGQGETAKKVSGKIKGTFYLEGHTVLKYGQTIAFNCQISLPENYSKNDGFDYRKYLFRKKIYGVFKISSSDKMKVIEELKGVRDVVKSKAFYLKDLFRQKIQIYITPPYSEIVIAMLLGDRQNLPESIKTLFINTGTMHVLAISGLHVGIICAVFFLMLKILRLPYKGRIVIVVILLILYAIMVGARASVWRASMMSVMVLLGILYDKKVNILNIIGLTFWIMLVIDPNYIYDPGFIMSYMCVFSIVITAPLFFNLGKNIFFKGKKTLIKRISLWVWESLTVSFSAWVGVMPVSAYFFHIITPASILVNLLAVPLCAIIVSLGILFFISIVLLKPLVASLAWLVQLMCGLLVESLKKMEFLGLSSFSVSEKTWYCLWIFYVFYFIIIWNIRFFMRNSQRSTENTWK
ncbi:MAG: ComEC/Rec2 family competence protein [Candidatus Omnitrophica bacterium]|nr:ComEC/Rec2 family competence protein [Candidatus Omnitrophota bacterium]